ncbi:MAG: hypothetical protein JETCAE02_28210 [Anaerolineaceae bacterium]|jgi:predicted nucleic acid-binding protein|nr:PIN domain-containing protein [Anaerolineae bacterium]MBL1172780.1 PIN domain-containing protein [Chloroflexota bacterium]MBV6464778.1 hypothetical protein [Anaerolineales bacterium]MCE7905536.1 PIN domain-containing protein [Anaerolineae bacterium CFX3]MDL1927139.1 type II toxin-antitoxin system VapC family toxin [Anaerolineae bacterium AMX1]OQY86502.1 MAG: hypothetical protein B6D40_01190 [Anaerolineae bacterium UTCFX3]GJQ40409.1 MAG: hypothetical protein JETCAE02_28210 [Anaerolineaceae 
MSYSAPSKTSPAIVVIDAGLGAGAVLAIRGLEAVPALLERWHENKDKIYVPEWWWAEVTSVVRQYVYRKEISTEQAHQAIDDLKNIEVASYAMNFDLLHNTLDWAQRIGQVRAYDASYLALAEHLNAELWTADKRLVNSTRALNIDWIKWIGDFE